MGTALFMRVGGGISAKAANLVGDDAGDCASMAADIFKTYEVTMSKILAKVNLSSRFRPWKRSPYGGRYSDRGPGKLIVQECYAVVLIKSESGPSDLGQARGICTLVRLWQG